ncbi:hypothetical protein K503DRAFT_331004 [Rhizopogon vinicolor AM-OR11-026]|uniref:TPR-like protein n=1 Tax=Rhizopogon vinicolor AM-OR11-026 TaxID=1314800 RepID=A0A1B7MTT5_9AGAM|nr:hypothetical protein K503DRAFT_331004 [Rhizopogon vinicolor AM-OR11-026]
MLGRGELMHEAKLTVGELLRHSNQFLPILFSPDASGSMSTTLLVKVDRDIGDETDATQFGQRYSPGSDESQRLGKMTETGQNLLVCYRRTRCISDYHEATEQLRLTLDHCGSDHPDRAAALTNLADALTIHPHIEDSDTAIDAPISLYREALGLRQPGHPDRPLLLRKLGLALLYRYNIRKNPADVMEGLELLNRAQGAYPDDGADMKPVIGAIRSATNSTPRSNRSSPVPTSPPSSPSQVSTISTASQPHKFPEALGRTADISERSASVSMRTVNGDSLSRHGQAEPSGDEKAFAAVPWDEIKAPLPACHSTQVPSHSEIPFSAKAPHLSPVIPSRVGSAMPMVPPVDMRVMQPQHLAAKSASPMYIGLIAILISLCFLLFMTR